MTSTLAPPPSAAPAAPPPPRSRRAGRRAIRRWAWRLLRREWRQQILILALLVVAVAGTTVGLGLIANVQGSGQSVFGSARTRMDVAQPASHLRADIAAAKQALGPVEVIEHENVPVPGSVTPVEVRARDRGPGGASAPPGGARPRAPRAVAGARMRPLVSGSPPAGAGRGALGSPGVVTGGLKVGAVGRVHGRATEKTTSPKYSNI